MLQVDYNDNLERIKPDAQPLSLLRVRAPAWRQHQQHGPLSACHCKPPSRCSAPCAGGVAVQPRACGHCGGAGGGRWWPVSSPRWSTGGCPNREECANGALAAQEVRVVCWLHALPSAKNLLLATYENLDNHKTWILFPNINRVAKSKERPQSLRKKSVWYY